jgi:protein-tyrosine kinase
MGKISDALERHKKEKTLKTEPSPVTMPKRIIPPQPEPAPIKTFDVVTGYDHKLVVLSAPDSLDAEHFKMLRAQLLFPREGKIPRTIMVTSTFPGEGKTYVAANLAVSIALGINEHVLLIDCDLRNPHVHKMLGYSNMQGMHEYLTGVQQLPDLIIKTGVEKLSLLCAGGPSKRPSELLSSAKMKEFLMEVRDRYRDRFIVIDSTPSHITAEASVLASFVDGIVFVVLAEKAPRDAIKRSIENLGKDKILGVVFNGYTQSYKPYEKYYKKYYGKSYAR